MAVTLAAAESAISAIQSGGQSVSLDGMQYTAGSLNALIRLRDKLRTETERSGGTRPVMRRFNMSAAAN